MNEKIHSRSSKVYLAITIALFLVVVISATYAFFASNINNGNGLNIQVSTSGDSYALTGSSTGNIEMKVTSTDMMASKMSTEPIKSDTAEIKINLVSPSQETMTSCKYDIVWIWESEDIYTQADGILGDIYKIADKQFCVPSQETSCDGEYLGYFPYEFSVVIPGLIEEQELSNLSIEDNKVVIANDVKLATSNAGSGVTVNHLVQMNIYNIPYDQNNIKGKNFSGHFDVENVSCVMNDNQGMLSDKIISLADDEEKVSISDNSVYKVVHETFEGASNTIDAGYRFEGANPDNYVIYNDELWRIISVEKGSEIGLNPDKYYTKIIRSNNIRDLKWDWVDHNNDTVASDNEGENDWTNSSLNLLLNNFYYNRIGDFSSSSEVKGLNKEARNMIARYNDNASLWHLRGINFNVFDDLSSPDLYEIERFTGFGGNYSYDTLINNPVGIMYSSDYGYAMYAGEGNTTCVNDVNALYRYSECTQYNWLYDGSTQWTIMPDPESNNNVFVSYQEGGLCHDKVTSSEPSTRPVVYLESDVEIISGSGSYNDPYEIYFKTKDYLNDKVIALANNEDKVSLTDSSVYKVSHETFTGTNGELIDAGYRYEGANPDNYVLYNNELWRIIGVEKGSNIGLEANVNYTKIIIADSIGDSAWDNDTNDWANSTLYAKLNGDYLNQTGSYSNTSDIKGLDNTSRNMIAKYNNNYSLWHLRGTTSYKTLTTAQWYETERITGTFKSGYASTITGAVGLMYPSDYGYAMYSAGASSSCINSTTAVHSYDNCSAYNWLNYNGNQWTITTFPTTDQIYRIQKSGSFYLIVGSSLIYDDFARPVLYLDSKVFVTEGKGSESEPYLLSIE